MRRKRNKIYLSGLYGKWINNIMHELESNQADRVLMLNECGWYPTTLENDEILKKYYHFEYLMRKIYYYICLDKKLLHESKLIKKEDIFDFIKLLESYKISTPFLIKYKSKLELHYPELK